MTVESELPSALIKDFSIGSHLSLIDRRELFDARGNSHGTNNYNEPVKNLDHKASVLLKRYRTTVEPTSSRERLSITDG